MNAGNATVHVTLGPVKIAAPTKLTGQGFCMPGMLEIKRGTVCLESKACVKKGEPLIRLDIEQNKEEYCMQYLLYVRSNFLKSSF